MEKELHSHPYSIAQIDSIYKNVKRNIDIVTNRYLQEVKLGKKEHAFRKWNTYVFENLNIDNLKLFEEKKSGK